MTHVYTKISRPDRELIEQFRTIGVATVYEAAGRVGSIDPAIRPLARGVRIIGPAVTVHCHPKDNLMLHKALQVASEGDVIVASVDGYFYAGYWGGLMTGSAIARRLGGLAIDGCVRDTEEIVEMGFPVFCRGACIRGTTKDVLGSVNHPILFGDIVVNPGDLILGDDDGMVAIPKADIEKVLEASRRRMEKEKDKAKALATGTSSVELNKLDKVFESLGLVEAQE